MAVFFSCSLFCAEGSYKGDVVLKACLLGLVLLLLNFVIRFISQLLLGEILPSHITSSANCSEKQ